MVDFPDPLDIEVEFAFGVNPSSNPLKWTWTSFPAKMSGISQSEGRPDEKSGFQTSEISFTVDNENGDLTPGYVNSPYFPNIRLNTPVRVKANLPAEIGSTFDLLTDTFNRTYAKSWGQPDLGFRWYLTHEGLDSFGNPASASGMVGSVDGARGVLALTGSGFDDDGRAVCPTLFVDGEIIYKVQVPQVSTGASVLHRVRYRQGGFYYFQVGFDTGGNIDVSFVSEEPDSFGNPTSVWITASDVLAYAANDEFWIRVQAIGANHKMKIWSVGGSEPGTWTVEWTDDEEWRGSGIQLGIFRSTENTNSGPSLKFNDLTVKSNIPPWFGFISEWTPEWPNGDLSDPNVDLTDPNETLEKGHAVVHITASGILRRIQSGEQPLNSAMYRAAVMDSNVSAYWSMEEPDGSHNFDSPIPGVPSMSFSGDVDLGSAEMLPGSKNLPSWKPGSRAFVSLSDTSTEDEWTVACVGKLDSIPSGGTFRYLLDFTTSDDTLARWRIGFSDAGWRVQAFDDDGVQSYVVAGSFEPEIFGRWILISISVWVDDSTNVLHETNVIDIESGNLFHRNDDGPDPGQPGYITGIDIGPMATTPNDRQIGQVIVYRGISSTLSHRPPGIVGHATNDVLPGVEGFWRQASRGWIRERVGDRLTRLCAEEGIAFALLGDASITEKMGPQYPSNLTDLFQDAEDLGNGIFTENRWHSGLVYRDGTTLESQNQRMILNASPHSHEPDILPPFHPVLDDKDVLNDVVVSRPGGSSSRAVDEIHVTDHGLYDESIERTAEADIQLAAIAGWKLHLGTATDMRYRELTPALNSKPELIPGWMGVLQGDRVSVIGLPPQHPAEAVELLVRGKTRDLSPTNFYETVSTTPGDPWNIGLLSGNGVDDDIARRVDSSRSYLGEDINNVVTSFDVVIPVRQILNTVPGFEGGIVVNDTVSGYTAYPASKVDWVADEVSIVRSQEQVFRGFWSAKITPVAPDATTAFATSSTVGVVIGDGIDEYQFSMWLYPLTTISVFAGIIFRRNRSFWASDSDLFALTANQWNRVFFPMHWTQSDPTNAVQGFIQYQGTPTVNDIMYADDGEIGLPGVPWIDSTTYSSLFPFDITVGEEEMVVTAITQVASQIQTFTVTRANPIAHKAGEPVRLHHSMRFSQVGGI